MPPIDARTERHKNDTAQIQRSPCSRRQVLPTEQFPSAALVPIIDYSRQSYTTGRRRVGRFRIAPIWPGDDWQLKTARIPFTLPLLGNLLTIDRVNPHQTMLKLAEKYGPVVSVSFGVIRRPVVLLSDPETVAYVLNNPARFPRGDGYKRSIASVSPHHLLVSEGSRWKCLRGQIGSIFNRCSVDTFLPIVHKHAARLQEHVSVSIMAKTCRLDTLVTAVCADVIFEVVFGVDLGALQGCTSRKVPDLYVAMLTLTAEWHHRAIAVCLPLSKGLRAGRVASSRRSLMDYFRSAIDNGPVPGSLLEEFLRVASKDVQPDMQLLGGFMESILLQGFRNTSAHTCWLFGLMAKDQALQDDLRKACAGAGHVKSVADLESIPLLQNVCREALRMYPSVPLFCRTNTEELATAGHRIPPNTEIIISPYVQHRLPSLWTSPLRFDPSRFDSGTPPCGVYFPHGQGERLCAARTFGATEAQVLLVHMLMRQRWTLSRESLALREDFFVSLRPSAFCVDFSVL